MKARNICSFPRLLFGAEPKKFIWSSQGALRVPNCFKNKIWKAENVTIAKLIFGCHNRVGVSVFRLVYQACISYTQSSYEFQFSEMVVLLPP